MDMLSMRKLGFFLLWLGLIFLSTLPSGRECNSIGKRNAASLSTGENEDNRAPRVKRVVGGRNATAGKYPWLISLHETDDDETIHLCGGAIIDKRYILTAAHCINFPKDPSKYKVLVGLHEQPEATEDHDVIHEVKDLIMQDYDDETHENDIALLRLKKPITFGENVKKIRLPPVWLEVHGMAVIAGWGATKEDGDTSDVLKSTFVPIRSARTCKKAFSDAGHYFNTKSMICAGFSKGGKDTCQGDSGGPLFQKKGISKTPVLLGIVSNGIGCGDADFPGIYTKVSYYVKWIKKQMKRRTE